MTARGATRRMLRSRGILAYNVVARRMALTLRRKSTANARGVWDLKNDCRACNADQRTTAAFQSLVFPKAVDRGSLQELQQ